MKYTYYLELQSDEHMLYADEVAAKFGLYSQKDILHSQFAKDVIQHCNKDLPRLMYNTRHGLKRVYRLQDIATAMIWLYSECLGNGKPGLYKINLANKIYTVKVEEAFFTTVQQILGGFKHD